MAKNWRNIRCNVQILVSTRLCARAEVKKGSFYHFFHSKSALASEALRHFWTTIAQPACRQHFSERNLPLARIKNFLEWLRDLQTEKYRQHGRILGWPFFTLGCELSSSEPEISEVLGRIAALETYYFESAIADAISKNQIKHADPSSTALALRATIEGVLGRARALNQPAELGRVFKFENRQERSNKHTGVKSNDSVLC